MENGFNMWSFNGKLLYSMPRDRFQQLSWRPRVPSLLTKEKEEEIRKNLKEYSRCVCGRVQWQELCVCLGGVLRRFNDKHCVWFAGVLGGFKNIKLCVFGGLGEGGQCVPAHQGEGGGDPQEPLGELEVG
jgi:hypothetical protein